MANTYWQYHPRDFDNEYTVAVATTAEHAAQYEAEGYSRIDRDMALHEMSKRIKGLQLHVGVEVDGDIYYDRFAVARALRCGAPIPRY